MKVLVTGWAGFIGTNFVRHILENTTWDIFGIDCHTYAARPLWALKEVQNGNSKRFQEYKINLATEPTILKDKIQYEAPDLIFHFAAESHVCNSITGPRAFVDSNIVGTFNLLEACRLAKFKGKFCHISTDEVYGELGLTGQFSESTSYSPRSPYAASKAASDQLVNAFHHTYGLDTRITNCSNNFGPNQHEEKLIPRTIRKAFLKESMILHGHGTHIRDWIWVNDHCRGILLAAKNGKAGSQYALGGECELTNEAVVFEVWEAIRNLNVSNKHYRLEITYKDDRPTDDARYSIDCTKARYELGFKPSPELMKQRIMETVQWYLKHDITLL
jgi:dTDP-glucose 4,6-dehydratase